jgi:hypothetical protein
MLAEESEAETLRSQAKIFNDMTDSLRCLSRSSRTFGALRVARVMLLWKRYFKKSLLFKRIRSLLLGVGSKQEV